MARTLDALAQFFLTENGDESREKATSTNLVVDAVIHEVISLTSNGGANTRQIPLTGVNASAYTKMVVFVQSDKHIRVQNATRSASADDLTTATGFGSDIAPGGFYYSYTTNTTELWVTNRSTGTAEINCWAFAVTVAS